MITILITSENVLLKKRCFMILKKYPILVSLHCFLVPWLGSGTSTVHCPRSFEDHILMLLIGWFCCKFWTCSKNWLKVSTNKAYTNI